MEEQQLLAVIEQGFAGFRTELRDELAKFGARIDGVETSLGARIDGLETSVAGLAENVHVLGLRFESFSDRLGAVNEHVTILNDILQDFRKDEFDLIERRVTRVETREFQLPHK